MGEPPPREEGRRSAPAALDRALRERPARMSEHDRLVERLCELVGLAAGYDDAFGKPVSTPLDARQAIAADLGFPSATDAEALDSIGRLERLRQGLLAPVTGVGGGRPPPGSPFPAGAAALATWRITADNGVTKEGRAPLEARGEALTLSLPRLPLGYYALTVEVGGNRAETTLIAAPAKCWDPRDFAEGRRSWGLAAQIYGLRSARNLGIGTYADAGAAAESAAALGAAFVGLSPVHALFESDRSKISPHSPSSRLFLETLHIDATAVAGFAGSEAARLYEASAERITALREATFVEHAGIWEVLNPMLEALWAEFRTRGGDRGFEAFRRELGEPLEAHATFEALSAQFR